MPLSYHRDGRFGSPLAFQGEGGEISRGKNGLDHAGDFGARRRRPLLELQAAGAWSHRDRCEERNRTNIAAAAVSPGAPTRILRTDEEAPEWRRERPQAVGTRVRVSSDRLDFDKAAASTLFPSDVTNARGAGFGPPETSVSFRLLQAIPARKEKEVSPTGFEPVLPA